MTMFLAREWGVHDLADALQASADARYQPTWDKVRGEFTWGFELDEPHPRGQYNGHMAAAEVMTEGAWSCLANVGSEARFVEPTVVGVDFPRLAMRQAVWDAGEQVMALTTQPMTADAGQPPTPASRRRRSASPACPTRSNGGWTGPTRRW